jgi:hypothetical protein
MKRNSTAPSFVVSRFAGCARVRLGLLKNNSRSAPQAPVRGETNGAAFNRLSTAILHAARCYPRPGCAMIQSP